MSARFAFHYKIRVLWPIATVRKLKKEDFVHSKLIEQDFQVSWNGSIEGTVKDAGGGPIHVGVELPIFPSSFGIRLPTWTLAADHLLR